MTLEEKIPSQTQEKDKKITEELQLKEINGFKTSGDITNDFNNLLELIDKDKIYKRAGADKKLDAILKALDMKKMTCEKILEDQENFSFVSEEKIKAEIDAIDRFFDSYSEKILEK